MVINNAVISDKFDKTKSQPINSTVFLLQGDKIE